MDEEKLPDIPVDHLMDATEEDLLKENIPSLRKKQVIDYFIQGPDEDEQKGPVADGGDDEQEPDVKFCVNADIIISNEFSQFFMGSGIVRKDDDEDEDDEDDEDYGDLPEGWLELFTEEGQRYYQDEETGDVQWHFPGTDPETYDPKKDAPVIPQADFAYMDQDGNDIEVAFQYALDENGEPIKMDSWSSSEITPNMMDITPMGIMNEEFEALTYDHLRFPFEPQDNDFTICCQFAVDDCHARSIIFANEQMGLQLFISQDSKLCLVSKKSAWGGSDTDKPEVFGGIQIYDEVPYHLAITFDRRDNEEKEEDREDVMDITAYIDGVRVGRINSEEKDRNFGGVGTIGGLVRDKYVKTPLFPVDDFGNIRDEYGQIAYPAGTWSVSFNQVVIDDGYGGQQVLYEQAYNEVNVPGADVQNPVRGSIWGFEIYYDSLTPKQIFALSQVEDNKCYKPPQLVSYQRESLKIAIPEPKIIYNGPIWGRMPEQIQQLKIKEEMNFTFACWICVEKNPSKYGGVIISKKTMIGNGFELICPMPNTNVIGMSYNEIFTSLGTTKIKFNKYYHVALTAKRDKLKKSTQFTAYINGKKDGSYLAKDIDSFGGDWFIGYRQDRGFAKNSKQKTQFFGSIEQVRYFQDPEWCFAETDIATLYAQAKIERHFVKDEKIMYIAPKDSSGPSSDILEYDTKKRNKSNNKDEALDQYLTPFDTLQWKNGKFVSKNIQKGTATIVNASGKTVTVRMNEIIKVKESLSDTIPGTMALEIENLGGMIEGLDFNNKKFELETKQPGILKYMVTPSTFGRLTNVEKYEKHKMQAMLDNTDVDNKYIINRLLYSSYKLLKDINGPKKAYYWDYFNQFILPWKVWKDMKNWKLVVKVAEQLQEKYLEEQKKVFQKLKKERTDWDIWKVTDPQFKHKKLINRQDCFDGGLEVEIKDNELDATEVDDLEIGGPATIKSSGKVGIIRFCGPTDFDDDEAIGLEMDDECGGHDGSKDGKKYYRCKPNRGKWVKRSDIKVADPVAVEYNKKVATMLLWGRCLLLDDLFQKFMKDLFEPEKNMKYVLGPIKTYERMMEKATEYRVEDRAPFPASFQICDVNRCSIKCETLNEVYKCFKMVCDNLEIIRIKNRFHPDFPADTLTGGYRDMLINALFRDKKSGLAVIAEVQVHLNEYEHIKHLQHRYYKIKRAVDYLSLLRNYEVSKFKKEGKKLKAAKDAKAKENEKAH